ncbi:MAG: class I SAM-dependent methyltransferase [Alphaproteobacteria bacterium]|nr:class I SAM-dependent methyltransferase [Alphaproteobacteria bacterium]
MPEAPLSPVEQAGLADVETLFNPPHDRLMRQRFISAFRKHVLVDKGAEMKAAYETAEAPAFRRARGRAPKDLNEVRQLMLKNSHFRIYSVLRLHGQEMPWPSVMDDIEATHPKLQASFAEARRRNPAGGTLKLDPSFKVPDYIRDQEMHHIPGTFAAEYCEDDVAQAAVTSFGGRVFAGGLPHRKENPGGVAETIANYLKQKFPHFAPKRILDVGTGNGRNLVPYQDVYPDAELYGVDVCAPGLRWGHAMWEARGKRVHLSQQNAGATNFPDGYFDLVVSSFFFHEIPVVLTKQILRENHRLLAKGGMVAHMELPPNCEVDPYYSMVLDWDGYANNEKDYCEYRAQVPRDMLVKAGFKANDSFHAFIPNWRSFGADKFQRWSKGEIPAPTHGNGALWFVFAATKA